MSAAGDKKRITTEDIVPEGVAGDADYQKAVQQLEDQQHGRSGWLAARGAFDKGDQAYMRDQEEQARHLEEAMADRELQQFAAARRRAEQEEALSRQRAATSAAAMLIKKKAEQKKRFVPIVKVRSAAGEAGTDQRKRPRIEENDAPHHPGDVHPPLPRLASGSGSEEQQRVKSTGVLESESEEGEENKGLEGLLGDYGSDSENNSQDDTRKGDSPKKAQLPSAADMLRGP